jgi:hypothetical protein
MEPIEFEVAVKAVTDIKEVIKLLNEYDVSPYDLEDLTYEGGRRSWKSDGDGPGPLNGVFELIENERDEGDGDYNGCHAVFLHKPSNSLVMRTGWYGSYDGKNFDQEWTLAEAKTRTITEYVSVK